MGGLLVKNRCNEGFSGSSAGFIGILRGQSSRHKARP